MRASDPFDVLLRAFEFMLYKIGKDDIVISQLAASKKNVQINLYHAPRVLTENAFVFDAEIMREVDTLLSSNSSSTCEENSQLVPPNNSN